MSGDGRERTNQMLEKVLKGPATGAVRDWTAARARLQAK
jgi:hypothetical protein